MAVNNSQNPEHQTQENMGDFSPCATGKHYTLRPVKVGGYLLTDAKEHRIRDPGFIGY